MQIIPNFKRRGLVNAIQWRNSSRSQAMTLLDYAIRLISRRRLCINNISIIDNMIMSGIFCSERSTQVFNLIDNSSTY